ncbi:MAG: adenylosuccinate lyase [bacterium]|nr:adenylosuccinate lyase [bacterium]
MQIDSLDALSPLDGRYAEKVADLRPIFSERGLMQRRIRMQCMYLLALSEHPDIPLRKLTDSEKEHIGRLPSVSLEDARVIKQIEKEGYRGKPKTEHDVKATEYYARFSFEGVPSLADVTEWYRFGLTSEDDNNIAYALQLREGLEYHLLPVFTTVHEGIRALAKDHATLAMLARTHGQPASPTTFGKEMAVFDSRLNRKRAKLAAFRILVKLNGATGGYNAHVSAFPNVDWMQFTKDFVSSLNGPEQTILFEPNLITTQVEPHDTYAELFDLLKEICTILSSFCEDMWRYISDDWVALRAAVGEIGSSVMPWKVNPINFENAEGNLDMAAAICEFFARKLPRMRLQRHLSDSTVIRHFGALFGQILLACKEIRTGLGKIAPNAFVIRSALEQHPEVIAEAYQTILRREGLNDPYKQLSELTRGKHITLEGLRYFVRSLAVRPEVQAELLALEPAKYIGLADKLALLEDAP